MSQSVTNCKTDDGEGRDPQVIARVITARCQLRKAGGELRRLVRDMELAFSDAHSGQAPPRKFADEARRACDAATDYRLALRMYIVASIALLTERNGAGST